MIRAVLSNPSHPEYGVATIPFPIPHDQYAHCMELLEALEIGDAVKADCKVQAIDSFYSVLKRTEMLTVNVEELSYLAKRLDGFDIGEAAQFQAMAHKLELFELKDLINLTFCCQQATVITDFSDLASVGRDHYMNLHGGCAKTEELDALDGEETARRLIENGNGAVTPYGVAYDNGMKLEQVYNGRCFPCYYYEPNAITVAVTAKSEPEDTEHIAWLFLPMVQEEIDRALQRAGVADPADTRRRLENTQLPNEVDVLLDVEQESLADDFRWYAAYHDEGHHPHVHMMVWSAEPKKGYLTREGIAAMRSKMTNAIFHEEMKELYIKKDAVYKESVQTARDVLLTRITAMENSDCTDPVIEQKLWELSQTLEQVDGRHVYGYLPKEVKAQVDEIVERLAQLPEVAACYDQWWRLKDEIAGYYGQNTPPHQPMVQQREFRAIKNMIIQQAETFRQPVLEQVPVETEPDEQQVSPSPISPVVMPQPQTVTSQIKIEGGAVIQLLHHMSRVFRGNMPVIPPALRIDSKRRRRLQEKRMAMGHKRDDHEEQERLRNEQIL